MALWSHSSGCFLVLLTLCFAGNKQMPYNCPIKPNKLYPKLNVYIIYFSVPSAIHAHTFLKAYSIQPNTYFLSYMSKHLGTHSYNSYGRKGTSNFHLQVYIFTCYWRWKLLKKNADKSRADSNMCSNLYLSYLQTGIITLNQVGCILQKLTLPRVTQEGYCAW